MALDFSQYTHISFDCYGTLINWERGILDAVSPVLARHTVSAGEETLLKLFAKHEAAQEKPPYQLYRDVLRGAMAGIAFELGFAPTENDLNALPDSLKTWRPFDDTVDALARLKARYRLVIISNVDDALFADTAAQLGVAFDLIVTAQRLRSYKPARENFRFALESLGIGERELLHVAQSLYHDHVPAKALGLDTVWVNRPSARPSVGVSLDAEVTPDLEVPDLRTLVRWMGL